MRQVIFETFYRYHFLRKTKSLKKAMGSFNNYVDKKMGEGYLVESPRWVT